MKPLPRVFVCLRDTELLNFITGEASSHSPPCMGRLQFPVRLPHPVICNAAIIYHFRRHLARLRLLGRTDARSPATFLSWMALRLAS